MNAFSENPEVMTFFKILVDPDRLRIAGLLGVEALTPLQLAERLQLSPSSVVTHLERLESFGLVQQQSGKYSLDRKALEGLARRNLAGQRPAPNMEGFAGEDYDRKVIRDFMGADGQFKSLPAQEKKFLAVLRYVANAFEAGVEYTEKQVNEILKRFHPDTATLRRGLIDHRLMQRDQGIYRKTTAEEKE